MIDEIYNAADNDPTMQKVLSYIHENAVGFEYTDTEPTEVPFGKFVIYDSGTEKKIYYKTGKNEVSSLSGFPSGGIIMWSGSIATIPNGWVICDGNNGTPNLTNRFVIAADAAVYTVGSTGDGTIPAHIHNIYGLTSGGVTPGLDRQAGTLNQGPFDTSSYGTGTKNIAVYYALAFIMKT